VIRVPGTRHSRSRHLRAPRHAPQTESIEVASRKGSCDRMPVTFALASEVSGESSEAE
jgi:hypothetical protein